MEELITVFDWRRQWLTVVCSISSIIWAEDTNWRPGPADTGGDFKMDYRRCVVC